MNFVDKFNKLTKRKIDYKKIFIGLGIILICGTLVLLNQNKSRAIFKFDGSGTTINRVVSGQPDNVAPTLTITSPTSTDSSNPTKATGTSYTVSGTATDASGIKSVTINGTSVTVSSNGSFSKDITLENGSTKTITIVATDKAGNTKTETRYVRYNEVPEELYIYQAGNTSWKNVIESSYSTTKTKATFGSSNVSIATSAYLGYAYLKVDFTNYDKLSITGYGGTVGYSSDKASFIESQQLSSSCEFDISNLSGEYYIMIRVTQVTPTTITQIKLG